VPRERELYRRLSTLNLTHAMYNVSNSKLVSCDAHRRCSVGIWHALLLVMWEVSFAAVWASELPVFTVLPSPQSSFLAPARVATDQQSQLYVSDPLAGKVVVLNSTGQEVLVKVGLGQPLGLAVAADGKIYVGDAKTGAVNVFDPQWNPVGHLGQGKGEFQLPGYVATLTENGITTIFVSDGLAHQIKAFQNLTLIGRYGSRGVGPNQFDFPAGICVGTNGNLFVVDQNNDRVQVLDRNGGFLSRFTLKPSLGLLTASGRAQGIASDVQGWLYVADTFQGHVKVFNAAGAFLGYVGGHGEDLGQLRSPGGLVVDTSGRLWVADANNGRTDGFIAVGPPPILLLNPTAAGDIVVTWNEPSFALQVALDWTGPWNTLASPSPFTVPASSVRLAPKLFFRLVRK